MHEGGGALQAAVMTFETSTIRSTRECKGRFRRGGGCLGGEPDLRHVAKVILITKTFLKN